MCIAFSILLLRPVVYHHYALGWSFYVFYMQVKSVYTTGSTGVPKFCTVYTSGATGVPKVCTVYTNGSTGVPKVCTLYSEHQWFYGPRGYLKYVHK